VPDYEDDYSGRNFNHRLKVETTYKDKVVDHRGEDFRQQEYTRNSQMTPPAPKGQQMESVTEVPARKRARAKAKAKATTPKQDAALTKAAKDDLTKRNIKQ
jgi:hypothetical protein